MARFQRQRFTDRLEELLAPVSDPGDLDGALRRILEAAVALFAPDLCAILAINPVSGQPTPPLRHRGALRAGTPAVVVPLRADGVTRRVLQKGIVVVENSDDHPEYQSPFVQAEQIRAFAAVAITGRVRGQPLAVLYLDYHQPRLFDEPLRGHIQEFADAAAPLLQQTWLLQRYGEVARIGKEINHELSTIEDLCAQLHKLTGQILDVNDLLMLAVYHPERDTLDLYMVEDGVYRRQLDEPLGGIYELVLRRQRTLLVRHLSVERADLAAQAAGVAAVGPGTESLIVAGGGADMESLIFEPLQIRDRALGVLSIQSRQPRTYDEEDARVLALLGNHVALALGNIRLFNRLTQVNEIGRLLTDRFDADRMLQNIADSIRAALKADLVLLYRYDGTTFAPVEQSGQRLHPDHYDGAEHSGDDVVLLALRQTQPVFARDSMALYELLGGDPTLRRGSFERREQVRSTVALPLLVGSEPLGVLFVNYRQPQPFDMLQRQSIESVASYATVALRSSQLFADQRERQLRELQILREIDRTIGATLDLELTLQIILNRAFGSVEAYLGAIYLYDPAHHRLETSAFICPSEPNFHPKLRVSIEDPNGLVGVAFRERRPVRIADVQTDPIGVKHYLKVSTHVRSELDVPLIDGDDVVGVLNLESDKIDTFQPRDEEFLVTLAGQAVLAIKKAQAYEREKRLADENAQAYEREKRLADERAALIRISREIIAWIEPEVVFNHILELALQITSAQAGTLMLYDSQRDYVHMAAGAGVHPEHQGKGHPISDGIVGIVARTHQLVNVPDVTQPPWPAIHLSFIPGVRSELAVPLLEGERLRGVINVESLTPNHFTDRDERLLTAFADQALIAMQHLEITRARQEAEERLVENDMLALVGQFAWEVLHELGNEVRPSKVAANNIRRELAALGVSSPLIEQELSAILEYREQARHILRILNEDPQKAQELLRKSSSPQEISVAAILSYARTSYPYAPDQIEVLIEPPPNGASVFAREQQVRDILRNLFTNAVQVQGAGGRIVLRATLAPPTVVIEVEDRGPGIAEEHLQRIFEPRYTTRADGTGFGLFSARRYARMNSGDLEVRSRVGAGSIFVLTLPLYQPHSTRGEA